jgi:alpha-methylacyl-CoA racemase
MSGCDVRTGPLSGLRVLEFAGIGPAPFGIMLLADLGAEVVRIERAGAAWPDVPIVSRGRASITLDLKSDNGLEQAKRMASAADILVEGFRPGVMERIGLGPEHLLELCPRLIYARMTGWGQTGPMANAAGHDINYIGLTGMLAMLGGPGKPPIAPQNLLGDYGAGGTYLALGILAALFERERSGKGQVIDAAIVDGSASMLAPLMGMVAAGLLPANPADGMLSGNAKNYRSYACADGRFIAVGSLEAHFWAALTTALDLKIDADPSVLEGVFLTKSRDEWIEFLSKTDCCVSPILDIEEACQHPHLVARETFVEDEGVVQPAPAPRFSRTPADLPRSLNADAVMRSWGVEAGIR